MLVSKKKYNEDMDSLTEILSLLTAAYLKIKGRLDELEGTTGNKKAKTRGKA